MDINQDIIKIRNELTNRNLKVTLKHFDEAISLFEQRKWESANGQIRSFLESLYNDVSQIVLKSNKTGGQARMLLQKEGIIDETQANFLLSFMKLAHTKGAHPGLSNESETTSRWYACLSLGIVGISLFPNIVTISDVFKNAGIKNPNGNQTFSDEMFGGTCPTCEESQFLSLCTISEENGETHYKCKNGCQDVLVISKTQKYAKGRGYFLKDYVLRNAHDILIFVPGGPIKLNKSPGALKKL